MALDTLIADLTPHVTIALTGIKVADPASWTLVFAEPVRPKQGWAWPS